MPMWARIVIFVSMVLIVATVTGYYLYRRMVRAYRLPPLARRVLAGVLIIGPLSLFAGRFVGSPALGLIGSTIALSMIIAAVLLLPVDLIAWIARRVRKPPPVEKKGDEPAPIGRRELVYQLGVTTAVGIGVGSTVYGAAFGRHDYQREDIAIPIDGLSRRLDGYRIAQISDIHFGTFIGDSERLAAVELMRGAHADLIVLTGDLIDSDPAYAPQLGRLVRQLTELRPRHGVVVIPGNHDHYTGVDIVLDTARRAGAQVLRNSARVVGDPGAAFALLGVDYGSDADLPRAEAMAPSDLPRILLCHDPSFFPHARGRVALQLSGHTHGGQVSPLWINPAKLVLPYVRGLYLEEGSRLYVNRGFGTAGPPVRVGSPPEVTVVSLTA